MTKHATTKHVAANASGTRYVALYCRISKDKRGKVEGVRSQEKWGRAYATQHWPGVPIRVFADNDLSAADEDIERPGYNELRAAITRGEVLHVWAVEQTRLERVETRWFALAAEMDAAGIDELHTNRDGIVRVMDEVGGIKAVIAAGEVRKLKRRVRDRLSEIAEAGRPHGGNVFGYVRGVNENGVKTLIVVPEQAAVIREAAERLLSGWSRKRCVDDLRARGFTSGRKSHIRNDDGEVIGHRVPEISGRTIKSWLTNPTVAGLRVKHDQIVGRGVWEPILDIDTWNAVRDRLAAPHTVEHPSGRKRLVVPTQAAHRARRRYLLTGGIAICGGCGVPLSGGPRAAGRNPTDGYRYEPSYQCRTATGGRGCVSIDAGEFEAEVVRRMLDELDKPEFLAALAADDSAAQRDEITTELRTLETRRRKLTHLWSRGELTDDEWQVARDELTALEHAQRVALAAIPPAPDRIDPKLLREAWPAMNLDEQRFTVLTFIKHVRVNAAGRTYLPASDPRRVPPIVWVERRVRD